MKALLVHAKDSPRRGPWSGESWDLVVDLGTSSESVGQAWENELGCPVLRLAEYRRRVEDSRAAGQLLRAGFGRVLDEHGLDWWELTSLLIHGEVETLFAFERLVPDLRLVTEFHATRAEWPIDALGLLLGQNILDRSQHKRWPWSSQIRHYGRLCRTLSIPQLTQILLDKHDADFRWRGRWATHRPSANHPVVLVPTAYTNVSRMAAAYAELLPEQRFLFVCTRGSGTEFQPKQNIAVAPLASYASPPLASDSMAVHRRWEDLRKDLETVPEFEILARLGMLDHFPEWIADGLAVRNAWLEVLRREPVRAVLCGDDSNWYTRLPVLLARARGLPTIDFHHGALDGRFLLKALSSEVYLAKSWMELDYLTRVCGLPCARIELGAPPSADRLSSSAVQAGARGAIVFFSEPYEVRGGRTEDIYRELLPALAMLAEKSGRRLVVKLHPFESLRERAVLVKQILAQEWQQRTDVVTGPLSAQLLESAWFGITLESTTVIDCTAYGVPCFLAGWIAASPYGYVEQYADFGIGFLLLSADELPSIPELLAKTPAKPRRGLWQPILPDRLRVLLAGGQTQPAENPSEMPQEHS